MSDAPLKAVSPDGWADRIHAGRWVIRFPSGLQSGSCYSRPDGEKTQPYILATPAALAASPEVKALLAAERDRCVKIIEAAGSKQSNRWINRADVLAALRKGE